VSRIVEIDDRGAIQLPDDLLTVVKPHTRFTVVMQGTTLILHPEGAPPLWTRASAAERAAAVRQWASLDRPPAPILSDEALHREQMYD
jgi:hypothetical protein